MTTISCVRARDGSRQGKNKEVPFRNAPQSTSYSTPSICIFRSVFLGVLIDTYKIIVEFEPETVNIVT